MKKFKVAVVANLKVNAPKIEEMPQDYWADLDSESTVQALVDAIRSAGHTVEFLEGDTSFFDTIRMYKPDICFNIAEGHYGDARESHIPAVLEMLRIPYTGSKVFTLALALDKPMTKRILHWHELPTPRFQTFEREDEERNDDMQFPLFVKPSREGTGMGVSKKSIVRNEAELRQQIHYTLNHYQQTVLVEQYIEGRELTVGVVGNLIGPVARRVPEDRRAHRVDAGLRFLPPLEVNLQPYQDSDEVYSNRLKSDIPDQLEYLCPAPISDELLDELNWLTAAVFRVTGALDVSRVDFRLNAHENWKPYILEINPLPGLSPGISDLVLEAAADGVDHAELVNMILDTALKRYHLI